METEPTDEQKVRFWEWCGFRSITNKDFEPEWTSSDPDMHLEWRNPNGDGWLALPPIDLNSLFKWAVPKLSMYEMNSYNQDGIHTASVSLQANGGWQAFRAKDPALALFWAISINIHRCYWKLIKDEKA